MESGPAIFAGTVFALFGGGLLTWTATRLHRREAVAEGVSHIASAALAGLAIVAAITAGVWCLMRL
ncbi:hypothetical protein AAW14_32955 [Streptomyces hygroscopicus]|uniref:hypothetical protein n=1 Tax=Streptomyces hygroscopicus TaxID=1912 RepID=UPI00223F02A6|nr:hypothetical protein [Streptomyces hygroscopicus]MCW7946664.1 hypothetical protein [Streptomyces hygroscopicus]